MTTNKICSVRSRNTKHVEKFRATEASLMLSGLSPPGSGTGEVPLPGKFLETVLFVTEKQPTKQPTSIDIGWSARKPRIDVARVSA